MEQSRNILNASMFSELEACLKSKDEQKNQCCKSLQKGSIRRSHGSFLSNIIFYYEVGILSIVDLD